MAEDSDLQTTVVTDELNNLDNVLYREDPIVVEEQISYPVAETESVNAIVVVDNVNESNENSDENTEVTEHPWPKLNKLFCLRCTCNQNLSLDCLLCLPKKSVIYHPQIMQMFFNQLVHFIL